MTLTIRRFVLAAALVAGVTLVNRTGQAQSVPVPRPFPGSGSAPPGTPARPEPPTPSQPAPAPVASEPLTTPVATAPVTTAPRQGPDLGGIPVYPTADFLEEFDAGRGQKYVLYGTNAPFATIVSYYRQELKTGGRELYRAPAMQQFDLGRFQDDRMAYPPSVVVKDYSTGEPRGYLFVNGVTEKRYQTVIQIVPPPPPGAR